MIYRYELTGRIKMHRITLTLYGMDINIYDNILILFIFS